MKNSYKNFKELQQKIWNIQTKFFDLYDNYTTNNKRIIAGLANQLSKLNLSIIQQFKNNSAFAEEADDLYDAYIITRESMQEYLNKPISEKPSKLDIIIDNIMDDYKFVKENEFDINTEDIVLSKIKTIENTINKMNLSDLKEEDYINIIKIKADSTKIKKEILGSIKSKKYGPLLKSALEDLMKKYSIIFNTYPYDTEKQQEKFNEIVDFLDLPKILDFYESIIKRIINRTISEKAFRAFMESIQNAMKNDKLILSESPEILISNLRALNESYAQQLDIENLVDDILHKISKALINFIKLDEPNSNLFLPWNLIDFSKYPELEKLGKYFVNIADITEGGIAIHPKEFDDSLNSYGNYSERTGIINVNLPINYFKKKFKLNNKLTPGEIYILLNDDTINKLSVREVLIHEFQHVFDDVRSNGKYTENKRSIKYWEKVKQKYYGENHDELFTVTSQPNIYDEYLKLPEEVNARFTEAISKLIYYDKENISLKLFIEEFKTKFLGWNKMSPNIKKSLIRKVSNFYYKIKENLIKENLNSIELQSLDNFLKIHEDFYNPFDDETYKVKTPTKVSDYGSSLTKRKNTYNLNKVEWSKAGAGKFVLLAKTNFAKGDIIEICPVILLPDISKTMDTLKDLVFEINKDKNEFGLVLGYGSLYGHSERSNVEYAYNRGQKTMFFIARNHIKAHEELTINYGTEYWNERALITEVKKPCFLLLETI